MKAVGINVHKCENFFIYMYSHSVYELKLISKEKTVLEDKFIYN